MFFNCLTWNFCKAQINLEQIFLRHNANIKCHWQHASTVLCVSWNLNTFSQGQFSYMNILMLVSLNSCLNYLKRNKNYSRGYNQLNSSQFTAVDKKPVWFSNTYIGITLQRLYYLQFCLWKKCSENTAYSSAAHNSRLMLKMKLNSWNNHKSDWGLEIMLHSERFQEHIAHLTSQRDSINWWLIWSQWILQCLSGEHIPMINSSIELSGNKTTSKCSKFMTEMLHGIQISSVQTQTSIVWVVASTLFTGCGQLWTFLSYYFFHLR